MIVQAAGLKYITSSQAINDRFQEVRESGRQSDTGEARRVLSRDEMLMERLRTEFGLEPLIQHRRPR